MKRIAASTTRITLLAAVVLAAAAMAVFHFTAPRRYFDPEKELNVHRVICREAGREERDISADVDMDALKSVLPLMQVSRRRSSFAPYPNRLVRYEMDGTYDGEPFHIVIGDSHVNYVYVSADRGGYALHDSGAWMTVMAKLRQDP